jgi:hypothetical protein
MTKRFRNNLIAVLIVIMALTLMALMSGCSVTSVDRQGEGGLKVTHRTFFLKTEAPSLEVERDSLNEYKAKFNAESRGGDAAAMAEALQLLMAISAAAKPVNE